MARGRRPDNSLEPSRQLLTQRAFRQRRAAHLSELEDKVRRLERENASLKGINYVEQEESSKSSKRVKTDRSTSGEGSAIVEEMDAEEEEDESELICERCAGYERDRLETLNAVSAVDNCLSQLSESMHILHRDLTKHTTTPHSNRRETLGSISPLQAHHLNMPVYQAHSTQTSPLSDTTTSHQHHQRLFLEVPNGPTRYSDLNESTTATSMTSLAIPKYESPTSPLSPFQAMNLSEPSNDSKLGRKKSHSRISNSFDEGQSSKAQSVTSTPLHHRSAASVSSIGNMSGTSLASTPSLPLTCTPRGGGCCSKGDTPTSDVLERAKSSMMPQAREGKNLEISAGAGRLLEQQQQQHQYQQQQSEQQSARQESLRMLNQANHQMSQAAYLVQHQQQKQQSLLQRQQTNQQLEHQPQSFMEQPHSPSHLPTPLMIEQAKLVNFPPTIQASNYPQIHLDESKCCLGIFECDTQGNILCGNN